MCVVSPNLHRDLIGLFEVLGVCGSVCGLCKNLMYFVSVISFDVVWCSGSSRIVILKN